MSFTENFMPLWGPYSKKYMGISKIIPSLSNEGARFDITVHPTVWNTSVPVPNVTFPSGYHLWECAADYSYFSYRYELMGIDEVYADISFSKMNDDAYLMRCGFVNNTDLHQNLLLNIFASLEFPFSEFVKLDAPENAVILKANDYVNYEYARPRPWDTETPDGMFKGMFRDKEFYLGCGLGDRCEEWHVKHLKLKPFGFDKGDRVSYKLSADGLDDPVLALRYRTVTEGDAGFEVNGTKITLPHSDSLRIEYLDFIENPGFVSLGGAGVEFDFIAALNRDGEIRVSKEKYGYVPDISTERAGEGYRTRVTYPYDGCSFAILTHNKNTRQRVLDSGCLEDALVNRLSNGDPTFDRLAETFSRSFKDKHSDEGFFHNTLIKAIFIDPHSKKTEFAVISAEDFEPLTDEEYENIYNSAREKADNPRYNPDGEKYELSTRILRSTLLTNAVYPVYLRGRNVVHHTPGKRWDSFYTWDSGLIGTGLLEADPDLTRYVLETYLSDDDNTDFDFVHHGSLVPTQFEEYYDLLNRAENREELRYIYPKMRRYYEFLRGRRGSSTCAKFGNGLLTVYDYWYSCSGMDDYPAQVEMIRNKAEPYSCPCLPTTHIIRAAKILRAAAEYYGFNDDIEIYDKDIEESANALNTLAWDEESGYYGYTMYDKDPEKPYIMKTADGENWNRGFDGIYPLFADVVPADRRAKLLAHMKNPKELWTEAGLSAVDVSASYYFDDGYWNGNVWISHPFFFWRALLDMGETDFAFEIASRALDVWKGETDFSYNTYECFGIKTKRGGWFHNFGGLSAPICTWANAYYKPGSVSCGYDVWTDYRRLSADSAEIKFSYNGNNDRFSLIVTLDSSKQYRAYLDGREISYRKRTEGAMEFTFDAPLKDAVLKVEAV